MKSQSIEWEEAAINRLKKAPFFIRGLAKRKVEKAAIELGETKVTVSLMEKIKKQEMD